MITFLTIKQNPKIFTSGFWVRLAQKAHFKRSVGSNKKHSEGCHYETVV